MSSGCNRFIDVSLFKQFVFYKMINSNKLKFLMFLFLITFFTLYSVTVTYADDIIESRREPVRRKSPSNSKRDSIKTETITNKSGAIETSVNNNKDKYNIDNNGPVVFPNSKLDIENNNYNNTTGKHINKRQQYSQAKPQKQPNRRNDPVKRIDSCPLCDSSVFSYCSDKLLHDACCCLNPFENSLPYQCQYADCSFLHSNSCREHHLITACCCDRFIYRL